MKAGLTVCALLALAARSQPPSYPPVADADPSVRHPAEVRMPSRLTIERTGDSLSVSYDSASLQTVKITIGSKMAVGYKDEQRVYPEGIPRPAEYDGSNMGSLLEHEPGVPLRNPGVLNSTEVLTRARGGVPTPGTRYIVERHLTVFETDIPAQHFWSPEGGKKFRVLWEETLTGKG